MISYFNDSTSSNATFSTYGDSSKIPTAIAQHLHRIAHEILFLAIYKIRVADIDVQLISDNACRLIVHGKNATRQDTSHPELISEILKYRMNTIGADYTHNVTKDGFHLICSVKGNGCYS